jgi:hypothetical protein
LSEGSHKLKAVSQTLIVPLQSGLKRRRDDNSDDHRKAAKMCWTLDRDRRGNAKDQIGWSVNVSISRVSASDVPDFSELASMWSPPIQPREEEAGFESRRKMSSGVVQPSQLSRSILQAPRTPRQHGTSTAERAAKAWLAQDSVGKTNLRSVLCKDDAHVVQVDGMPETLLSVPQIHSACRDLGHIVHIQLDLNEGSARIRFKSSKDARHAINFFGGPLSPFMSA